MYDNLSADQLVDKLRVIHRLVEHITNNDVRETRDQVQRMRDFKDQRVKYIVGEMSKQQLSAHIFRTDKIRQKNTEMLNVYELLSAVGIDFFNRILAITTEGDIFMNELNDHLEQYDKLRAYCNGLFAIISNTYNMTVPQITKNWVRISEKFSSKSLKQLEAAAPAPMTSTV